MTEKLILLFPSPVAPKGIMGRRKKRRKLAEDITNRLARVKETFAGTRWQAAWDNVSTPETLIAARLEDAGDVTVFRSKRRSNDAFQIAVEIAHLAALDRLPLGLTRVPAATTSTVSDGARRHASGPLCHQYQ
jgi:hypothetical protein